eukprot:1642852-Amphidinium_carterae.1
MASSGKDAVEHECVSKAPNSACPPQSVLSESPTAPSSVAKEGLKRVVMLCQKKNVTYLGPSYLTNNRLIQNKIWKLQLLH